MLQQKYMKRLSIITWVGSANYGTSLQCFALYKKLNNMGYEVACLRPFEQPFTWKSALKNVAKHLGILYLIRRLSFARTPKLRKTYNFMTRYYVTDSVYCSYSLKKLLRNTDVFITGSDQIWNTYYKYDPFYFLGFTDCNKKISYASSIGADNIPQEYYEKVHNHLTQFSHIAVREDTAVKVLKDMLGRDDITKVLDPTLLLESEEWKSIAQKAEIEVPLPSRYILCYFVGNNDSYIQYVERIKQLTGINDVIMITSIEHPDFTIPSALLYRNAGPIEFVSLIQNASFVCTDSFHATVFSINLSRNFAEFVRFKDGEKKAQNSRIYDVLEHYNLMDRLCTDKYFIQEECVDFDKVHSILENDRKISLDYLVSSIEK